MITKNSSTINLNGGFTAAGAGPTIEHDSVSVMGLELARVSEREAIETALSGVRAGRGGWICPANLDVLRQVVHDDGVRRLLASADLVVADGMPLVWASRLQRSPVPERVAGSSLAVTLPPAAALAGASVYLLGGNPGVAEHAGQVLMQASPTLRIAGTHCPPMGFERSPQALEDLEGALLAARPDVVFVALGFPKQEHLIRRLRPLLPATWFVSCGISLSLVSGAVARAPVWVQRLGLEWVHRLAQEPRRLARRYLLEGLPFVTRMLAGALRLRYRAPSLARR
jgi:N-acetylglucosaminyldiphosphoundecaprenol N-acetyl-beta-D-mannosaminyltransferase